MNPFFSPRKEIELFWLKPRDLFLMSLSALGLTWDGYRCVWILPLPKRGSWSIKLDCWFLKGPMGKVTSHFNRPRPENGALTGVETTAITWKSKTAATRSLKVALLAKTKAQGPQLRSLESGSPSLKRLWIPNKKISKCISHTSVNHVTTCLWSVLHCGVDTF